MSAVQRVFSMIFISEAALKWQKAKLKDKKRRNRKKILRDLSQIRTSLSCTISFGKYVWVIWQKNDCSTYFFLRNWENGFGWSLEKSCSWFLETNMLSLIEIPRDTSAVHMLVLWHHPEYEIRLYCWSSTCPRRKRDRLSTLDRKVSVQFPRLSSDRAVDYRNIQLNLLVCCHEKTNRCPISPLAILRYVCN